MMRAAICWLYRAGGLHPGGSAYIQGGAAQPTGGGVCIRGKVYPTPGGLHPGMVWADPLTPCEQNDTQV